MAAHASSSRLAGFAVLAVVAVLRWRCAPAAPGFVAGSATAPSLRAQSLRLRSPAMLFAATDDTMAKVADVVAEQLGVEQAKVTREATLTELGADSLDIVESVMALEEAFDVELPDEETTTLKDVGDVADLIQTKL
mmetsp:Transcript_4966/g.11267  ORF Transcript_4966/g.11267 Transcript_4966/m.11267 type:complete len:136 (+) Transcript_4966:61-468(+)|eukprot:CAMPEP_0197902340 /NCGR_PEP_ID=MMETSP1439-20131203/53211_1 /TAXON_ID=66791 /ORGANISM="Gonyaulax spinifera, Strain CCMP409" /LENGTH=135 /DNA_ID=CAMNT_0043523357 /DNA_START=60 /DNA_END=467 /DNA_ORIENTATION=-